MSVVAPSSGSGQDGRRGTGDEAARVALEGGLQTTSKRAQRGFEIVNGAKVAAANPYLALVPDPTVVDWSYWKQRLANGSAARALAQLPVPPSFVYREKEPRGSFGANDNQGNAERIDRFGTGAGQDRAVHVLGRLSPQSVDINPLTTSEDNGSIPLATPTGISGTGGVAVSSQIGDGPHGTPAPNPDPGDFDFFRLQATAGKTITVDTRGSDFDTIVAVWSADGTLLALDDDSGGDLTSLLLYNVEESAQYYVMVAGFFSLPTDPFDSGSGEGAGDEGSYDLALSVGELDRDYYAVRLRSGDVLGGTIAGAATDVVVHRYDRVQLVGSQQDASFIYPADTPLPGGGNAVFAYVAEETGLYAVSTEKGDGPYQLDLEVYRPGLTPLGSRVTQTIFLDFDGERINTGIWGGPGVRTLSPLRTFLPDWGLGAGAENRLIDQIVATVEENLRADLRSRGLNDDFAIRIINSRDDPDLFGQQNVSRVIVGGTIEQSGIPTIGIAQSIDPGNFAQAESALVLLDVLSGPADGFGDPSLNTYLHPRSDEVEFIGTAVGNVTSHEVGHYIGSFHVDQFDARRNLMDQGGNFPVLYGVGPDRIGGTADDLDVDFGENAYNPFEGFTGLEDTLNNSAWASHE